GLHDLSPQGVAVMLRLLRQVVEVGAAEGTSQHIDVKLDVLLPGVVQRVQQITADGASARAAGALLLPDLWQQAVEGGCVLAGNFTGPSADLLAKLLDPSMLPYRDARRLLFHLRSNALIGPLLHKN